MMIGSNFIYVRSFVLKWIGVFLSSFFFFLTYCTSSCVLISNIWHCLFRVQPFQMKLDQDSFLHVLWNIHSWLLWFKHQRKTNNFDEACLRRQLWKPMMEQNVFHMTHAPPISRLDPMEYIYLVMQQSTTNEKICIIVILENACN